MSRDPLGLGVDLGARSRGLETRLLLFNNSETLGFEDRDHDYELFVRSR